jgi:ComF family protein
MLDALLESARGWLDAGLGLVYPEVCQLCGQARATLRESFVCAECRSAVRYVEPPFCSHCGLPFEGAITVAFECAQCMEMQWAFRFARSAVVARDPVLEIIHRYKYKRAMWFEPLLAEWLISRAKPELQKQEWDGLVPVPLHRTKQREREFNQAERLAKRLSQAIGIPVNQRWLRRVAPTRTQTLLSREERMANVRNAFALRCSEGLEGQRLVLIDDVLTTGATTSACARALLAGGAGDVCVWTVARGT